ncbi:MAG: class I SAM-dependent methyltransferase [Oscillospiraceae bacterium]|nr:class I SAM-dependent methyltransferase [Oscillospiraceae bacterium]
MIAGDIIADVGSDHAYLPIWLWQNKKIKKAYALDISVNSITKIKKNLKKYDISENIIIPVLSDGLLGLAELYEVTDIVIAGIGGENISQIIKNIETDNMENINFILQPNTKVEFLREFLYKSGFDLTKENVVEDENRLYNIICAVFIGKYYEPKPIEIIAGKNIKHPGYINKVIGKLYNILIDLDEKCDEKFNIKTEFGYYKDIENLISELKNYD